MTRPTPHLASLRTRRPAGRLARRFAVPFVVATGMVVFTMADNASAGIVPTVTMGTASQFSVLAGSAVTNTGSSVLHESLGLSPGSAITGFPPGNVVLPATTHISDGVADQAQLDLTAAYVNAANRPVEATNVTDLVGLTLAPGVYDSTAHGPIGLTGQLVLDGGGNANAVFIFQTGSTLITGAGSTVELINGASECNVFWQVGSSATLATNSVFVGNILALTSITVQTGAVVHGRALARNGAVTLDNDTFTAPSCVPSVVTTPPTTTTTTTTLPATTVPATTTPATTTPVTTVSSVTTTPTTVPTGTPTTVAAVPTTIAATPSSLASGTPSSLVLATIPTLRAPASTIPTFNVTDITLPRTGSSTTVPTSMYGGIAVILGAGALVLARRRRSTI